ncbi:hypothetical protein B0H19DRAFT_1107196 [Mycena capillaripes]|nr:hypothetical protein B0H19DRAFT_1107196 [Mycena capillaripes]
MCGSRTSIHLHHGPASHQFRYSRCFRSRMGNCLRTGSQPFHPSPRPAPVLPQSPQWKQSRSPSWSKCPIPLVTNRIPTISQRSS